LISPQPIPTHNLETEIDADIAAVEVPPPAIEKRSPDGNFILNPQPEDSPNDPLNWPVWRRNLALLALGVFCMIGGGLTPALAAGFPDVAATYHVATGQVALTVGFFMLGIAIGGLLLSPTSIIYGKRLVYLVCSVGLLLASVWCAVAPSFTMLIVGRLVQGIGVSVVEVLPSATISEIFFLHERAFRLGIYTMMLLVGKNLFPLLSAVVIQVKGWRAVFW
jgi:MFS family permease